MIDDPLFIRILQDRKWIIDSNLKAYNQVCHKLHSEYLCSRLLKASLKHIETAQAHMVVVSDQFARWERGTHLRMCSLGRCENGSFTLIQALNQNSLIQVHLEITSAIRRARHAGHVVPSVSPQVANLTLCEDIDGVVDCIIFRDDDIDGSSVYAPAIGGKFWTHNRLHEKMYSFQLQLEHVQKLLIHDIARSNKRAAEAKKRSTWSGLAVKNTRMEMYGIQAYVHDMNMQRANKRKLQEMMEDHEHDEGKAI